MFYHYENTSPGSGIRKFLYEKIYTYCYYHLFFKKKFSHIGSVPTVWGIRNIVVFGPNISIGGHVVFIGGDGHKTNLSSIRTGTREGRIDIGDHVLIMNGVRISSASSVTIADSCMLANNCYLNDSDWHDIHDRSSMPGASAPIVLERGAWIGDSAIVCKGVRIGENSIIGAGSVVTRNVPANVIAAGNPARVVKRLDPKKIVLLGDWYKAEAMKGPNAGGALRQ
jgi:acetyltransferase-like isoleucine patch superfamily enzyme